MNYSSPFQNFFKLLKYGFVSQILYFLTIPIILNKYDPKAYGIFTIVFGIASVIGTLSSLRLERAIVVEDISKIQTILRRCFIYTILSTLICLTILYFSLIPFNLPAQDNIILIVVGSIYCLFFGLLQIFTHLAIRQEKLILTGISDVFYSFLLLILLLLLPTGSHKQTTILIVVFTLSRLFSLAPFIKLNIKRYLKENSLRLPFKEQRKYHIPVFTVLLSNLQFKGLLYIIGIQHGGTATGQLSIAQRVVYAPVSLFGATLRKSFFLEFAKKGKDNTKIAGYIHKILNIGSLLSLIIFPVFVIIMNTLKTSIPSNWVESLTFAVALYPVASILVLLSWLDRLYDANKKQATALYYEIAYTFLLYVLLFTAIFNDMSALNLVKLFTTITVFYNLIWAALTLRMVKLKLRSILIPVTIHLLLLMGSLLYLR